MRYLLISLLLLIGCTSKPAKTHRIAILTPVTHPSLEQIEKEFIQFMEKEGEFQFDVYNGQGNKTLIRSEIEEIIRRDYDLIFTIGTLPSHMMTEVMTKKGKQIPIVFTAVNNPEGCSGKMTTGVKELLDFKQELAILLKYKPSIKRMLLVYNPTEPGLVKDQREVARLTKEEGIELITVEIFQTNELIAKVLPFMSKADALLILKDNSVVTGLDALVKLCNQYHIPLMASDLDSPDKGAAFGFGVYESDFGKEAAKKALLILKEGVAPINIPITSLSEFSMRINYEAAEKQGVSHDALYP